MTASLVSVTQTLVSTVEGWLRALWASGFGAVALCVVAAGGAVWLGLVALRRRDGRFTRDVGRLGAIATAAAGAWAVAGLAGSTYQAFAAAAAVGSVGLGIAYSLRDAASGVAATVAGLLCAYAVVRTGATDLLSVLAAAGVAWAAATWFGANSETAASASVASVFATSLGDKLTDTVIVDRLLATCIGAVVGIGVSSLPWWGTPARAAKSDVRRLAGDVADVWRGISATVAGGTDPVEAAAVLEASRQVLADAAEVNVRVKAAVGHMRYSPVSRSRDEGARLARLGVTVTHGASQVNNAARALFDIADSGRGGRLNYDGVLRAAADTAADVYDGIAEATLHAVDAAALAGRLDSLASQAAQRMRRGDQDTGVILLGGQLVAAAAATSDALHGAAAIETDLPDVGDIVPALKPRRG